MEEWRDIKGYEGKYQVSNLGRIKSLSREDASGHKRKEKILKGVPDKDGYLRVALHNNGIPEYFGIHQLVAATFLPNPKKYPIINHKDENPSNNNLENLEWCTYKYNINYGTRNKKVSEKRKRKVKCLTTGEVFNSLMEASEKYNIHNSNITNCCRGKRKTAGKMRWEYMEE